MNRRKAIKNLLLAVGATTVAVPGYKWYSITSKPALSELLYYKELISEMAETIIPHTDTPGAKDAHAGDFVIRMVRDCTDIKSQNRFLYGLQNVEDHCKSRFGTSFINCTIAEREQTLLYFEQKSKPLHGIAGKVQHKLLGTSFFDTLKYYSVMGYCISASGATKGLVYDMVPGTYQPDLTLRPGQRSWATK